MAVFIVTWKLWTSAPCPDYKQDEYGRWPTFSCAVNHIQSTTMKKEFITKKEADEFVKESGWEPGDFSRIGSVTEFLIEEVNE